MNKDLRDKVRAWVEAITGAQVQWDSEPVQMTAFPGATSIFLNVFGERSVGADELRGAYASGVYSEELVGWRLATLALRCEVYDSEFEALDVLEDLRTDTNFLRVRRELAFEDVAVQEVGEIRDIPAEKDTRTISVATMDIRLSWQKRHSDKVRPNWIQTATGTWVDPE